MDVDAALSAVAGPVRRQILRLVRDEELPAGVIAGQFAVSPQAISQHLRQLREAGLLVERRDGTRRFYRADAAGLAALAKAIDDLVPPDPHERAARSRS